MNDHVYQLSRQAMNERVVRRVNDYWRERGRHANARIEEIEFTLTVDGRKKFGTMFAVVSDTRNGKPLR